MQALNTGVADMPGSGAGGVAKGAAGGGLTATRRGGGAESQTSGPAPASGAPASAWQTAWHSAVDGGPAGDAAEDSGGESAAATLISHGETPAATIDPTQAGAQPDSLWLHTSPAGWAAGFDGALADPGGEELPFTGRLLPPGSLYAPPWLLAGQMSGQLTVNGSSSVLAGAGRASTSAAALAAVDGDAPIALSAPGSERGLPTVAEMLPAVAQPVTAGQPARSLSDALGLRLQWMAQHGHQQATLQLHPERLGTLEIRLRIEGDTAHLQLNAHAQARESLEQAAPRLREMLDELGLAGAQIDIQTRAEHRDQPGEQPQSTASGSSSNADADADENVPQSTSVVSDRLLDVYA